MIRGLVLLLPLVCLSCSSTPDKPGERRIEPTLPPPTSAQLPEGSIVRTSRATDFVRMIDELAKVAIVYVGEVHTNPEHHLVQLRIIEQLHARGRLHAIGMEMFQRKFQPVLDAYTQARIGEEELLRRTEYKRRWGYDFAFYRPILEFARKWRLPVLALNVEREIRKKVSKGGLDALSEQERRTLPAIDTSNKPHRAYLREVYQGHLKPGQKIEEPKFERFYTVMCMWDDVMADSVVRWFGSAPENAQIVVLAGGGHIGNRYGIPDRVRHRLGKRSKTVIPVSLAQGPPDRDQFAESYADFLWLTDSKAGN